MAGFNVHPWLTHRRLAAGNRWRRWRRNQPEGSVYLLASAIALAILVQPLLAVMIDYAGVLRSLLDRFPWLVALLSATGAALGCRRPLMSMRETLRCGLWCALPLSRRMRDVSYAGLTVLMALFAGAVMTTLMAWLAAPITLPDALIAAVSAALATLCTAALRPKAAATAAPAPAASGRWSEPTLFPTLLRRWQRQRLSFHWRSGAMSSSGLLLSGLLLPAGTGMAVAVAGLIAMLLVVRILALHNSAASLVVQADLQLRALPVAHRDWFAGHARAVLPEALLLSTLIGTAVYAVGAPLAFVLGTTLLLILLSLIDMELVSRWRRLPRRRAISWTVLATTCAVLGPQAAPLIPALLLLSYFVLRVSRPK